MTRFGKISRRALFAGAAQATLLAACARQAESGAATALKQSASPVPLDAVRLKPSPFLDALEANKHYLHRLEPDRFLHNFRLYAGLEPKGVAYGGWEGETIAGHSLGHYLSAASLMHAQAGDDELKSRALYIVDQLEECQRAAGDGYVAGFTRKNEQGEIEPGRAAMEEIAQGDIRAAKFYINGSWAPFYNWHKLFAGLFDARRHCGATKAITIAEGLAGYIESVFAPLSGSQIQEVLSCEHGGVNESMAELYALTGDVRWLALAKRLYHKAVLDPLSQRLDELSFIHANTQIPKLIGLARLYQLTGERSYSTASNFFWETVTSHRSYVIGGNSDREYFQEPNSVSKYITEQTCESCNTYNMMKLTRSLHQTRPNGAYFDYYERCHFNHILAQQRPEDGMFAYMVPLMSGAHRSFSEPFDSFWCCVGTGMESHAKHGDSIYWRNDDVLFVNLFIRSELDWTERQAKIALETDYPFDESIKLTIDDIAQPQTFTVAFRAPAWCDAPAVSLNGAPAANSREENGYISLQREWRQGDVVELLLPLKLRMEPTPDDPDTIALLYGPLVLAADLGPIDAPYDEPPPALVGKDVLAGILPVSLADAEFRSHGIGRPADMTFRPFFRQRDRRTAVYFKRFTPTQWETAQAAFASEARRHAEIEARSVDSIRLGDEADEEDHNLDCEISYAVKYRNRSGRDARTGGFFAFEMNIEDAPLTLQATYWGGERERAFDILVEGVRIATNRLEGDRPGEFFTVDYEIPTLLVEGKSLVRIRFEPHKGFSAGPVFGVRIYKRQA